VCARYSLIPSKVERPPRGLCLPTDMKSRFNINPHTRAPVVRMVGGSPRCDDMRWGFQPRWLREESHAQINVRAEHIFDTLMFKESALERRCIVPASGWYEWPDNDNAKQPLYLHRKNDGLIAFAGIWVPCRSGDWVEEDTYAIITTNANPTSTLIHNRTPAILSAYEYEVWLDPNNQDPKRLRNALRSYRPADLESYPVGPYVNNPMHNTEKCIERLEPPPVEGSGAAPT